MYQGHVHTVFLLSNQIREIVESYLILLILFFNVIISSVDKKR